MDCVDTKILFCFDFDHTIIDLNSDTEVFKLFPNQKLPEDLKRNKN